MSIVTILRMIKNAPDRERAIEVVRLLVGIKRGMKIQAIKAVRELTQLDLVDAKNLVEEFLERD